MESSGAEAPNHTPAETSQEPSGAWSLALIEEVCGFHEAAVLAQPLASVTTTWDSPVVAQVMRNGKSPVVEVSPNGHVSARDPAASAPNSIVWGWGIIVCTIYLRVWRDLSSFFSLSSN